MEEEYIHSPSTGNFPTSDLTLGSPHGLQGGAYFSRLKLRGQKVSIQTPKSLTKDGIHKTDKKIYCDLMFEEDEYEVVEWIQQLEGKLKSLIYEKRDLWFNCDMDMDTIEYHWQPSLRTYKGRKQLLRCFIQKPKTTLSGIQSVQIYDEGENLLQLDDVEKNKYVVSILEVAGLKFTTHSFSVVFHLKQLMVLAKHPISNRCLIKIKRAGPPSENPANNRPENPASNRPDDPPVEPDLERISDLKTEALEKEALADGLLATYAAATEPVPLMPALGPLDSSSNILNEPALERDKPVGEVDKTGHLEKNTATTVTAGSSEQTMTLPVHGGSLEGEGTLNEIHLVPPEGSESLELKAPNEVYLEIYMEAKRRAKEAKIKAVQAYLEAKRIKSLYVLDEVESSDEEINILGFE